VWIAVGGSIVGLLLLGLIWSAIAGM